LQLVNSAFFGIGREVVDPVQAATLLGLDTLKSLVLSIGVFSQFNEVNMSVGPFTHEALYHHSMKVAQVCKAIAESQNVEKSMVDLCHLSGMLHDIGKLILVHEMPDRYEDFYRLVTEEQVNVGEAELSVFGVDHGKVGAYLLSLWAIPRPVVEAAAFHHDIENISCTTFSPLICTHVADALVSQVSNDASVIGSPVNTQYLEKCGLGDRLEEWEVIYQNSLVGEA